MSSVRESQTSPVVRLELTIADDERLVYEHAAKHFGLLLPESTSTINILPVDQYVEQIASMNRDLNDTLQKWSYVVHDCSSSGSIPLRAYSREFWTDLDEMLEVDALVTVVCLQSDHQSAHMSRYWWP
jgi:hypothetical protein